jgi:hypothetical protein
MRNASNDPFAIILEYECFYIRSGDEKASKVPACTLLRPAGAEQNELELSFSSSLLSLSMCLNEVLADGHTSHATFASDLV